MPPISKEGRPKRDDDSSSNMSEKETALRLLVADSSDEDEDIVLLTYNPLKTKPKKHQTESNEQEQEASSSQSSTGSNMENKDPDEKPPLEEDGREDDDDAALEIKARAKVAADPFQCKLWAEKAKYKVENLMWHLKPTKHGKHRECFPCYLAQGLEAKFMTDADKKKGKKAVAYLWHPPECNSVTPSQLIPLLDENQQIPNEQLQAFMHTLQSRNKDMDKVQLLVEKCLVQETVQLCLRHQQSAQQANQQEDQQQSQQDASESDHSSEDDERDEEDHQQQQVQQQQRRLACNRDPMPRPKSQTLRAGCIIEWYPPNEIPRRDNLRRSKVTKVTPRRKAQQNNLDFIIEMDNGGGIPGLRMEDRAKMVKRIRNGKLEPNPTPLLTYISQYRLVESQMEAECSVITAAAAINKAMDRSDQQLMENEDTAFLADQLRPRPGGSHNKTIQRTPVVAMTKAKTSTTTSSHDMQRPQTNGKRKKTNSHAGVAAAAPKKRRSESDLDVSQTTRKRRKTMNTPTKEATPESRDATQVLATEPWWNSTSTKKLNETVKTIEESTGRRKAACHNSMKPEHLKLAIRARNRIMELVTTCHGTRTVTEILGTIDSPGDSWTTVDQLRWFLTGNSKNFLRENDVKVVAATLQAWLGGPALRKEETLTEEADSTLSVTDLDHGASSEAVPSNASGGELAPNEVSKAKDSSDPSSEEQTVSSGDQGQAKPTMATATSKSEHSSGEGATVPIAGVASGALSPEPTPQS